MSDTSTRDLTGEIATARRNQAVQYWINKGVEDARAALVDHGPEAALAVLAQAVGILLRLGWVPPRTGGSSPKKTRK